MAFLKAFSITDAFKIKTGFTLAEVLITLGIIGVVAAMTLPALVRKYREKILVSQVKKSYAELQNALKMYAAKNECTDISCISDLNSTSDELMQKLSSQFSGTKICEQGSNNKLCQDIPIKNNTPLNNGSGQTGAAGVFATPYFLAANGAAYRVVQYNNCLHDNEYPKRDTNGNYIDEDNDGNYDTEIRTVEYCADFYFDANGTAKGPNQFGADIYRIVLLGNNKFKISTEQLTEVLTKDKLNYIPYEIGQEMKF